VVFDENEPSTSGLQAQPKTPVEARVENLRGVLKRRVENGEDDDAASVDSDAVQDRLLQLLGSKRKPAEQKPANVAPESSSELNTTQASESTVTGEGGKKKYHLQPGDEGYSRKKARRWNRMKKHQQAKKEQERAQVDDAAAKSTHSSESQSTRPTASTEQADEPMDTQHSEAPPAKRACSEVSLNPGSSASQRAEHAMQEKLTQMQEFMMKSLAMQQQQSQQQAQETAMLKAMLAQVFPLVQAQPQVTQEQAALQAQQQQAALHAQQFQQQQFEQLQQQQLAAQQHQFELLQQQQLAAQQQPQEQLQAAIPDHAFVNPATAMQAPFIVTQNGPTYVTPPTQGVNVTYVRAPTPPPRPPGPDNIYPPSDNDPQ